MNHDRLSSGLFFLLGLLICLQSLSYGVGTLAAPESGLMPFLSGATISLLAAIGFVRASSRGRKLENLGPMFQGVAWQRTLLTLAALLGFLILLKPLGFLLFTFVFMVFMLRAIVPHRWGVVIGVALLTAVASYLIFDVWLKAQLPKGPLGI